MCLSRRSRRPCNGNPVPRPRDEPAYFIDECLDSQSVHDALVGKGAKVVRHRDRFAKGTQDVVWLPQVGAEGLVVITADDRIRKVELEIAALWNSGVAAFIVRMKDTKGSEIASILADSLATMGRMVHTQARPFIARISRGGVAEVRMTGRKSAQRNE